MAIFGKLLADYLTLTNTILTHNTAAGLGGGVYLETGTLNLLSGQILSNTANNQGGGVYINNNTAVFVQSGGVISDNLAVNEGGGVFNRDGRFTLTNGQIKDNRVSASFARGGGVYVDTGLVTLNGGEISLNQSYRGGGLFVNNGSATLAGANILTNTATYGGGLYIIGAGGTFTQTAGAIAYNQATTTGSFGGGGAYLFQGMMRSLGGEIHHNTSGVDAGGIHVTNATAFFDGASLHDNTALGSGGAIHIRNGAGVLTVTNSILSNNSPQGISMAAGTASLTGSQIDNSAAALKMTGGTLTAYANNIFTYTAGIASTGGTFNGRYNFWGSGATAVGVGSSDAHTYRLGAPVSGWAESALGGASLTAETGAIGTGIIISHGRGVSQTPFGAGVSPHADVGNMCSDFYDFFVMNGSGSWTVKVPVDSTAACDTTFANGKLYGFTLNGTAIDETCTGAACWTQYSSVISAAGAPRTLQVSLDAASQLQATPIVAGNQAGSTPSALRLRGMTANGPHQIPGLLLLAALILFPITWAAAGPTRPGQTPSHR